MYPVAIKEITEDIKYHLEIGKRNYFFVFYSFVYCLPG